MGDQRISPAPERPVTFRRSARRSFRSPQHTHPGGRALRCRVRRLRVCSEPDMVTCRSERSRDWRGPFDANQPCHPRVIVLGRGQRAGCRNVGGCGSHRGCDRPGSRGLADRWGGMAFDLPPQLAFRCAIDRARLGLRPRREGSGTSGARSLRGVFGDRKPWRPDLGTDFGHGTAGLERRRRHRAGCRIVLTPGLPLHRKS